MSGEQLSGFQWQLPRRAFTNGSRKFNQLRTAFLLKPAFRSMTPTPASRTNCGCVSLRSAYVFDVLDVFNVLGPAGRADNLDAHFLGFLVVRRPY